ncbi:MAG: Fur family transcriptional regulator [Sporichthyaceae bacterium]
MTSPQTATDAVAGPRPRSTRQRTAVSAALDTLTDFVSAQELHDVLKTRGENVGLTTVYRALQALAEGGGVDVLRTADGEAMYRRCSTGHHHHLVCRACGNTVEVKGLAVERWADKVAAQHGYVEHTHAVEIFGLCPKCAKAR